MKGKIITSFIESLSKDRKPKIYSTKRYIIEDYKQIKIKEELADE